MGEEVMVIVLHHRRNIIEEAEVQAPEVVMDDALGIRQHAFLFTNDANEGMNKGMDKGMDANGKGAGYRRAGNMAQIINERKDKTTVADAKGHLLTLRHPKSDASTSYVYKDGFLLELHWFKQSYGSWFLGDYVCADGSLYVATPVDPIFIFLPIFADARLKKGSGLGRFREIDEILYVEGYPGYRHLVRVAEESMQLICEVQEVGSSKFFRLDDSKVLSWLCCKVLHLKASLEKLDKNYAIQDEKETLKEIVSMLGDYMKSEPWLTNLCIRLKLSLEDVFSKAHKNEPDAGFLEEALVSPHSLSSGKLDTGRTKSSNGKQPKKLKTETNSRNIKDMFRSASKRRKLNEVA